MTPLPRAPTNPPIIAGGVMGGGGHTIVLSGMTQMACSFTMSYWFSGSNPPSTPMAILVTCDNDQGGPAGV